MVLYCTWTWSCTYTCTVCGNGHVLYVDTVVYMYSTWTRPCTCTVCGDGRVHVVYVEMVGYLYCMWTWSCTCTVVDTVMYMLYCTWTRSCKCTVYGHGRVHVVLYVDIVVYILNCTWTQLCTYCTVRRYACVYIIRVENQPMECSWFLLNSLKWMTWLYFAVWSVFIFHNPPGEILLRCSIPIYVFRDFFYVSQTFVFDPSLSSPPRYQRYSICRLSKHLHSHTLINFDIRQYQ